MVVRFGLAEGKFSPRQLVRFREIEPILAVCVAVKLDAVRIFEIGHVRNDLGKLARNCIKTVENVHDPTFIVHQVIHIRNKDTAVRRFGKKPHPFQPFDRRHDLKFRRQIEVKCFAAL